MSTDLKDAVSVPSIPKCVPPIRVDQITWLRSQLMENAPKGTELVIKKVDTNSYRCNFYLSEKPKDKVVEVKRMYKSAYVVVFEENANKNLALKIYWD